MNTINNEFHAATGNVRDVKRLALEAKLALAIKRAQRQYEGVRTPEKAPQAAGPSHLGSKIDIRV